MKVIEFSKCVINGSTELPFYSSRVQAGFPSPADEHLMGTLDLNTHLISRPASTFFVKVTGDSMINIGIRDGDLLVVDKSLEAKSGRIVIAVVGGEFTVKRFKVSKKGEAYLMPENESYPNIKLDNESYIWGVVTSVIHQL